VLRCQVAAVLYWLPTHLEDVPGQAGVVPGYQQRPEHRGLGEALVGEEGDLVDVDVLIADGGQAALLGWAVQAGPGTRLGPGQAAGRAEAVGRAGGDRVRPAGGAGRGAGRGHGGRVRAGDGDRQLDGRPQLAGDGVVTVRGGGGEEGGGGTGGGSTRTSAVSVQWLSCQPRVSVWLGAVGVCVGEEEGDARLAGGGGGAAGR